MSVPIRAARVSDAAAIAAVHVASWQSAYRGILPDDLLANLSVARREAYWQRVLSAPAAPQIVLVATDEQDAVVGFASGGPERDGGSEFDGELYTIYLLAAVQRRGIGRTLAQTMLAQLHAQGFRNILVWVLADNPACAFYAALGALPAREQLTDIGGVSYRETGYGWYH